MPASAIDRHRSRDVAIIGGGLAGIAAAMRLLDSGDIRPILIESRKRLGGRATSLVDPRSGQTIDNCQHVLLGCCTNLLDLYARLGVLHSIEWHRTLYWTRGAGSPALRAGKASDAQIGSAGEVDTMKAGWLPAPFHLSGSFRRMRIFDKPQKQAIARAMWRMIRMEAKGGGGGGRFAWRNRTFLEFLRECDQPEDVIRGFWNTIIISACNLDVSRVSALYALQVFQDGFLANRWSYTMGLSSVPLAQLYDPAIEAIESAGGEVRLGCSAKAIAFDGKRVTGVVTDDGFVESSAVISAVPFDRLDKLISDTLRRSDVRLKKLNEFSVSPILGVHLRFDQEIMKLPHLVLVDPPHGVQWLFNKGTGTPALTGSPALRAGSARGSESRASTAPDSETEAATTPGSESRGTRYQHIHAVISGADDWMALDEDEIVRRVVADIHHALPNSIGLQPVDARAIKEKRATFAAVPGIDSLRPSASPAFSAGGGQGVANLMLAGDWCDTGWPATMEGAVRSGYAAAEAITGASAAVEEVPVGMVARLLGMRA